MWIIHYLPDFVAHFIVLIGIVGVIITSVPVIWRLIPGAQAYQLVIQLCSIILVCFGLYLEGGMSMEYEYKIKVAGLEKKLAVAKAESANVNTEVVTEYVIKKQVIKQKGDTITEYIDREVIKYDKTCPIPESVINSHNAAARNDPVLLSPGQLVPTTEHNALTQPIKMAPRQ